jgi:hypothetical protein
MRKVGKRIIFGLLGVSLVTAACVVAYIQGAQHRRDAAKPAVQSEDGPWDGNQRTISHPDGTRSVYIRTEDHRTLSKHHYAGNGELSQMTVYRMDEKGNVLAAKIFDGRKKELYKISYGYRKSDGALVEERVFDSRNRRISPEDGKEMPIWRFIHQLNESGKPIDRIKLKGKGASESEEAPQEITPLVNPFSI